MCSFKLPVLSLQREHTHYYLKYDTPDTWHWPQTARSVQIWRVIVELLDVRAKKCNPDHCAESFDHWGEEAFGHALITFIFLRNTLKVFATFWSIVQKLTWTSDVVLSFPNTFPLKNFKPKIKWVSRGNAKQNVRAAAVKSQNTLTGSEIPNLSHLGLPKSKAAGEG